MTLRLKLLAGATALAIILSPQQARAVAYASEFTQILNNLELLWGNVQQAQQLVNEAKMLAGVTYDASAQIKKYTDQLNVWLEMYEDVIFQAEKAIEKYDVLYPDVVKDATARVLVGLKRAKAKAAREAGKVSKATSSDAVETLEDYTVEIEAISEESLNAVGQTGATQAGTQATLVNAGILQQFLAMQAAHNRAVEAPLDEQAAAEELAYKTREHLWRNVQDPG